MDEVESHINVLRSRVVMADWLLEKRVVGLESGSKTRVISDGSQTIVKRVVIKNKPLNIKSWTNDTRNKEM